MKSFQTPQVSFSGDVIFKLTHQNFLSRTISSRIFALNLSNYKQCFYVIFSLIDPESPQIPDFYRFCLFSQAEIRHLWKVKFAKFKEKISIFVINTKRSFSRSPHIDTFSTWLKQSKLTIKPKFYF